MVEQVRLDGWEICTDESRHCCQYFRLYYNNTSSLHPSERWQAAVQEEVNMR